MAGVLNLVPVKYPRVIKQITINPIPRRVDPTRAGLYSALCKAVDFTLLHHNNARSGKIYAEFSIGQYFPLVEDIKK